LDAWRFEKVMAAADSGNVGALRLLDQLVAKNDMMLAATRLRDAQDETPLENIGKKEMERRAAHELTSSDKVEGWDDDLKPGYAN